MFKYFLIIEKKEDKYEIYIYYLYEKNKKLFIDISVSIKIFIGFKINIFTICSIQKHYSILFFVLDFSD